MSIIYDIHINILYNIQYRYVHIRPREGVLACGNQKKNILYSTDIFNPDRNNSLRHHFDSTLLLPKDNT